MSDIFAYLASLFAFNDDHPLLFTQIHFWVLFFIIYLFFSLIVTTRKSKQSADQATKRIFRNGYLFFFSLFFYYKTSGPFVLLLIFSTLLGWSLGIGMDHTLSQSRRKLLRTIGVVVNLGILCFFKYAYFFTDIFNATFHTEYSIAIKIILPVGISFFTFQNISYIVDVYKRKISHVSNILDFGFYTAFFPQLVAGPILRADQFVPQIYKPFFLSRRQFGIAIFWIVNGLIKKLVLADYIAACFVDRIFENPNLFTPFENFSGLMLYSLQVYADFSGYTDIAIGVAMLMGFYLPVNFNSPYKAQNPTDFWRRWHMSLSRWLRDYLYIPLGGNRTSGITSYCILFAILLIAAFRLKITGFTIAVVAIIAVILLLYFFRPSHRKTLGTNVNNMDTMLLGGLWHGSSFNFITWGGLNGLGILVYKWWKESRWSIRFLVLILATSSLGNFSHTTDLPLLNLLYYCAFILLAGFSVMFVLGLIKKLSTLHAPLSTAWAVAITFVFISFTRLFFRSGSNLDPAKANEQAWQTASMMVERIGSQLLGLIKKLSTLHAPLSTAWAVAITFVFISFTRLFFRSGSNLDPAEANEQAWQTASMMVERIGSQWELSQIPAILANYWNVFLVFAIGMIIHWLPTRFKRRYRLWFASMPLWLIAIVCVLTAVVLYQFVTAGPQPFIYFQF